MIMKKIQLIATFMIVLVMMLPICFSADYVAVTKVSGGNDVWDSAAKKGYMRRVDVIKAEVEAEDEDDNGNPKQVSADSIKLYLGISDVEAQGQCTLKQGSSRRYICTYESQPGLKPGGEFDFKAQLCEGTSCSAQSVVKLIVDKIGPEVTITSAMQRPGELNTTVIYSVQDYAYDANTDRCSGIDRVEFYLGSSLQHVDVLNQTNPCSTSGRETSFLMGGTGTINLTLKAFDKVGNEGEPKYVAFLADHSEPLIVDRSFKIKDSEGNVIHAIPSSGFIVSAEVLMESDSAGDIVGPLAYADFSALSTEPGMDNKTGTCTHNSTRYFTCRWTNLKFDKSGDGSSVTIYAKDSFGNMVPQHQRSTPPLREWNVILYIL